jgi:putative ABC transport system permease protein
MVIGSILGIAFNSLLANKLRSSLTLLGVIFGVTSVMTIISALEGMMGAIKEDLATLGPATFIVDRLATAVSMEEFFEKIKRKPINLDAAGLIEEGCTLCDEITPYVGTSGRVKYRNNALRRVEIRGVRSNYIDIVEEEVVQGRFHSLDDDLHRRNVAFIGENIKEKLFPDVDPLGKDIKVNGHRYTVIGVAKKQGSTLGGESEDTFVAIPLSAYHKQFGRSRYGYTLLVKANSVDVLPEAMDEVRVILRAQRHVPYNDPDDFDMVTAENVLDLLNQITKIFRMGLIGISSISLVVGGVVVMNIMMVSVTERTREIGIRKSLGAKQGHILSQFLFEALILTLSGGIIGIILGYFIAKVLIGLLGMEISPSGVAIFFGLFISTSVGLFFGIYPAMKAARLDPVKALSYE